MFSVVFTPLAQEMLSEISDRRIQQKIVDTASRLTTDPEKQGKPLVGPLTGYRSLRAAGQRYRIIYTVKKDRVIVAVVGVGIRKEDDRKDIYKRLQKLVRLRLI
jgi:mRNA interferase RelE/StbE